LRNVQSKRFTRKNARRVFSQRNLHATGKLIESDDSVERLGSAQSITGGDKSSKQKGRRSFVRRPMRSHPVNMLLNDHCSGSSTQLDIRTSSAPRGEDDSTDTSNHALLSSDLSLLSSIGGGRHLPTFGRNSKVRMCAYIYIYVPIL